jgi:hypothetical protein
MAGEHSKFPVIQNNFTGLDFLVLHFDAILLIGSLVHLQDSELAIKLAPGTRLDRCAERDP